MIAWLFFIASALASATSVTFFSPPSILRIPGGVPYANPLLFEGNDTSQWNVSLTSTIDFGFYIHPQAPYMTSFFDGCDHFLSLECDTLALGGNLSVIQNILSAFVLNPENRDGEVRYVVSSEAGPEFEGVITVILTHNTVNTPSASLETALLGGLSALVAVLCLLCVVFLMLIRQRARAFFSRERRAVVPFFQKGKN